MNRWGAYAVALASLAWGGMAQADTVRWAGWSADETKVAYFLRQPHGETGFTDITLIIRDTGKGSVVSKEKIRDARKVMDSSSAGEETPATLDAAEQSETDDLKKKGFLPGKPIAFKMSPADFKIPSSDDPPAVTSATLTVQNASYTFTADPSKNWSFLRARVTGSEKPSVAMDQQRIWPMVRMEGTPDEQIFRAPANTPTSFNLSPKGQWMASAWEGRMNLPDGLSWPAYAFTFRASHLPRK